MGDAVRSYLISLDYSLGKSDMESVIKFWELVKQDYAVLVEALKQLEVN